MEIIFDRGPLTICFCSWRQAPMHTLSPTAHCAEQGGSKQPHWSPEQVPSQVGCWLMPRSPVLGDWLEPCTADAWSPGPRGMEQRDSAPSALPSPCVDVATLRASTGSSESAGCISMGFDHRRSSSPSTLPAPIGAQGRSSDRAKDPAGVAPPMSTIRRFDSMNRSTRDRNRDSHPS
jgi:hypothetical protein